jgi:hypothetical protein
MKEKIMVNRPPLAEHAPIGEDALVDAIVSQGPSGTFAVAGVATAIVVAIYFAFYFFAYLPRGAVQ